LLAAIVDRAAAAPPAAEIRGWYRLALVPAIVGPGAAQATAALGRIDEVAADGRGIVGARLVQEGEPDQGGGSTEHASEGGATGAKSTGERIEPLIVHECFLGSR
jgi:hypothetical protein